MRRSAHAASGLEPSVCWAMRAPPLLLAVPALLLRRARLRRVNSPPRFAPCRRAVMRLTAIERPWE